jgi:hypothetical protein
MFVSEPTSNKLSLVAAPAKQTAVAPGVTAFEFSGSTPNHQTRLIEEKFYSTTFKRILGRFVNQTGGVVWFPKAKLYRKGSQGSTSREVTSSYIYPTVLLPGDVGYYTLTPYGLETNDELAVAVTDWMEATSVTAVHRFPVSNVTWKTEGTYAPTLKVAATVKNDTDDSVYSVDVLIIVKDKTGKPIKIETPYFGSIAAKESSTKTMSVYSGFDGFDSIEVIAYTD